MYFSNHYMFINVAICDFNDNIIVHKINSTPANISLFPTLMLSWIGREIRFNFKEETGNFDEI